MARDTTGRGVKACPQAILEQLDASLAFLGTDYVDLYQIPRFDDGTPVEETMEVLATRPSVPSG